MGQRSETKKCPVCSAAVFADMDTCFNCMYRFGSNERLEAGVAVMDVMEVPDLQEPDLSEPDASALPKASCARHGEMCQLREFLVEFEGFLREFLLNREVDV